MKRVLAIGVLVVVLAGGYASAQGINSKGNRGDTGNEQAVSVVDHAKYCTKDMKGASNHGAGKTSVNDKENNSSDDKELHKTM